MSAVPGSLRDHRVIHSALGLKRMISVERNPDVFAQQQFNRPLREIHCIQRDIKAFVDGFTVEIKKAKVSSDSRFIVWLDFEAPDELMSQLQTFQALIDLANDGDVIRITLNAHAGSLGSHLQGETDASLQVRRMEKIKTRFGDFLPEDVSLESTQNARYPGAVLGALKLAVMRATGGSGRTFLPLLIVQYADGQPMLTVTGVVLPDIEVAAFVKNSGVASWPHYANSWSNVERVATAPHLTLRERMLIDQAVLRSSLKLPSKLQYLTKLQRMAAADLLRLYRRYQRFFPLFQNVDP